MKPKLLSATTFLAITTFTALSFANPANAGTFPGLPKIIMDTLPCNQSYSNDCIMLRERVNVFQGWLGKSKPAAEYCRAKYGNQASVVWKLGLRWCATPYQI